MATSKPVVRQVDMEAKTAVVRTASRIECFLLRKTVVWLLPTLKDTVSLISLDCIYLSCVFAIEYGVFGFIYPFVPSDASN